MADETVRGSGAIIYKVDAGPVSVAQAKQLVLDALPPEKSGAVIAQVDENGEFVEGGWIKVVEQEGVQIYASFMGRDFIDACKHLGIEPRLKYRPIIADYTGADAQDEYYTITHDEFVRYAGLYGVTVEEGKAPQPSSAKKAAAADVGSAVERPRRRREDQWKVRAQERAQEIIDEQRKRDLHPSQVAIADQIAREFRSAVPQVVGADGKPLTGETIKRHALKGISSAQGKAGSTQRHRGK